MVREKNPAMDAEERSARNPGERSLSQPSSASAVGAVRNGELFETGPVAVGASPPTLAPAPSPWPRQQAGPAIPRIKSLPRQATYPRLSLHDTCDLDTATDEYAARFSGAIGQFLLSRQHRVTFRLLRPFTNATVLDLGGGHGQNAHLLHNLGHHVTVFGSDPACAYHLQHLIADQLIRFETGDFYAMPYADQEHEVVVSYRMLAHVQDTKAYIAEMCRVAERAVMIDYASKRSFNALAPWLFNRKRKFEKNTRPFAMFHGAELDQIFQQHGFKRIASIGQFVLPMVLHRAMNCTCLSRLGELTTHTLGLRHHFGSPIIARYERVE